MSITTVLGIVLIILSSTIAIIGITLCWALVTLLREVRKENKEVLLVRDKQLSTSRLKDALKEIIR